MISPTNNGLGGVLVDRLHQFSREVVDLIKHQPGCKILLSKFIPTYHHHFGKQCRVADYGFSKLHELIDALPQVVHVIGFGYMRILYLSHKVQVRRFTNELMKVIKSQSTKTCSITEYPMLYKILFHKEFNVTDYGVCYLEDLIEEIPDSTVDIIKEEHDIFVSMPKRIQTPEEKERTTQFAAEVIDLLKETTRCKLPFNKFIPSYHHHFSRQCKVAEYGFTKLIELLEAIPSVVQIVEEHGEKYVLLTQYEMIRVFGDQTLNILEKSFNKRVELSEFSNVYLKAQGYPLNVEDYMVNNLKQLINRIPKIAKMQSFSSSAPSEDPVDITLEQESSKQSCDVERTELFICLADRNDVKYLAHKVLLILLEVANGSLPDYQFLEKYRYKYREEPNITTMQEELYDIVQMVNDSSLTACPLSNGFNIRLKPLILLSRDLKDLIKFNQSKMPLMQLESLYEQQFGIPLKPQDYGYPSLLSLIQACDFVVSIKGRGIRATLILHQDFVGKLAYRVAYSTEPFISPAGECDDITYHVPQYNSMAQPSSTEIYDQSTITLQMIPNNQNTPSMIAPKPGCVAPLIYNHYINPQTNFLQTMNNYPYYNTQPIYNAWFQQWYQPHASYGYPAPPPPNMYQSPDYSVLPLPQSAIPPTSLLQICASYLPVASQDQREIDELVETLAYDNSCSSRMTPPPPLPVSLQHVSQTTYDATNPICANPWMSYAGQQMMPSNVYHCPGYQTMLSTSNGDDTTQCPSEEHHMSGESCTSSAVSITENVQSTNNNNNSGVKEFTESITFSAESRSYSRWKFSKTIL